MATARRGVIRRDKSWVIAELRKIEPATAPATAWLSMPITDLTNAGATAMKSPVTANPANAAVAAVTKTGRISAGTESR